MNFETYKKPLLYTLLIHAVLFLCIFFHISNAPKQATLPTPDLPAIQAVSVNANEVEHEIKKIKLQKQREQHLQQQMQQQKKQAQRELAKLNAAKRKMQQDIAKAKKLAAIQKRKALTEKKKVMQEQKKLAVLKKKQQAQALAEKKKQLAEQKKKQAQAEAQAQQSEINKYKALIVQAIGQHWIVPDNTDKQISCELAIRLAPQGVVLSVSLIKSSGNPVLDRSAQAAVMQASPLPVPENPDLFNQFRELNLTVRPT